MLIHYDMVTLIVNHGLVLSREPRSEAKEALMTEMITTFYLSKQDLHQEYSLFSSAGACVLLRDLVPKGGCEEHRLWVFVGNPPVPSKAASRSLMFVSFHEE
jgi:hypothetical protein